MSYSLYIPESLTEAIELQQRTGGAYLAGGTVTLVDHHRGKPVAPVQISLDRLPELRGIELQAGVLSIGALTTMDQLEHSADVKKYAFALWQAACEVAGPQVRNRATLGGNLAAASPSSDCAPPVLALNGSLQVQGPAGKRVIPARDFFLGRFATVLQPGEIIRSILLPASEECRSAFRKVGKRNALAVSCLNMAVARLGTECAVAAGAAAPKPLYCAGTSEALSGDRPDSEKARALLQQEISPIDDRWGTASYRRLVSGRLLEALLAETEEER